MFRMRSWFSVRALALVAVTAAQVSAATMTLDWGKVTPQWTMYYGGAITTASFDIDPTHAGNDVTIQILLGNGASWVNGGPTIINGPNGPALSLGINTSGTSSYAAISFDFHYTGGVKDIQMLTNNIDRNALNQAEQLRSLYGTFQNGAQQAFAYQLGSGTTATGLAGSGTSSYLYGINQSNGVDSNVMLRMASQVDYLGMTLGLGNSWIYGASTAVFNLGSITYNNAATTLPPPPPPTNNAGAIGNPEPSTWVLMTTGLAGLAWVARRRKRA